MSALGALLLAGGLVVPARGQELAPVDRLALGQSVVLPGSDRAGPPPDPTRTCDDPCGEPMLAVGPGDTLWVSAPGGFEGLDEICCNLKASPLWRSEDGGQTWAGPLFPTPSSDASDHGPSGVLSGRDTAVAVDAAGNVYVQEAWVGNNAVFLSEDRGETWLWSPVGTPGAPSVSQRPWMEYSAAHDALFTNYYAGGDLWLARAEVGGPAGAKAGLLFAEATVYASHNQACVPVPERTCLHDDVLGFPGGVGGRIAAPGRLAVDQRDGTIYIPVSSPTPGEGMRTAVSDDGGRSFRFATVPESGMGMDGSGGAFTEAMFASAAVDGAGNAYLTWVELTEEGTVRRGVLVLIGSGRDLEPSASDQ